MTDNHKKQLKYIIETEGLCPPNNSCDGCILEGDVACCLGCDLILARAKAILFDNGISKENLNQFLNK